MNTYEEALAGVLQTLTRRVAHFEPEVRKNLRGVYRLDLQDETGQARRLWISIADEMALMSEQALERETLRIGIRGTDFVSLVSGATDPLTLYTNERMSVQDGDANPVPFEAARRLLQMLLVEWRVHSGAIAAIEAHGAVPEERTSLDRVRTLGAEEFLERYAYRGTPVVLAGEASAWPLSGLTPEGLCERMGDYAIAVFSSLAADESEDEAQARPVNAVGRVFTKTTLREFFETVFFKQRSIRDLLRPAPYITAHSIPELLLELIAYPPFFDEGAFVRPKMWAGPAGTLTSLHRDLVDNFLAQVWGFKHLRLVSPIQTKKMYPEHENLNPYYDPSRLNIDAPDLDAFPDCADVPYIDCVLGPGDMLYLPAGWWHQVRSLEPSLSINFFALNQQPMSITGAARRCPA